LEFFSSRCQIIDTVDSALRFDVAVMALCVSMKYVMSGPAIAEMDDRFGARIPSRYVTRHPGQINLLHYVVRKCVPAKVRSCSVAGSKSSMVHFVKYAFSALTLDWDIKPLTQSLTVDIIVDRVCYRGSVPSLRVCLH